MLYILADLCFGVGLLAGIWFSKYMDKKAEKQNSTNKREVPARREKDSMWVEIISESTSLNDARTSVGLPIVKKY